MKHTDLGKLDWLIQTSSDWLNFPLSCLSFLVLCTHVQQTCRNVSKYIHSSRPDKNGMTCSTYLNLNLFRFPQFIQAQIQKIFLGGGYFACKANENFFGFSHLKLALNQLLSSRVSPINSDFSSFRIFLYYILLSFFNFFFSSWGMFSSKSAPVHQSNLSKLV